MTIASRPALTAEAARLSRSWCRVCRTRPRRSCAVSAARSLPIGGSPI